MALTVTKLARECGLARGTLLYYESIGLLPRPKRTAGNYRVYSERERERLRQICVYRDAGVPLADIRSILSSPVNDASAVLRRRLVELSAGIEKLREQQRAIALLLKNTKQLRNLKMMTKDKWVAIMKATGFTENDMHRWHAEFERSDPEDHAEFLEYLHIPKEEQASIRKWSREFQARA